jgi:hypothetical protein
MGVEHQQVRITNVGARRLFEIVKRNCQKCVAYVRRDQYTLLPERRQIWRGFLTPMGWYRDMSIIRSISEYFSVELPSNLCPLRSGVGRSAAMRHTPFVWQRCARARSPQNPVAGAIEGVPYGLQ